MSDKIYINIYNCKTYYYFSRNFCLLKLATSPAVYPKILCRDSPDKNHRKKIPYSLRLYGIIFFRKNAYSPFGSSGVAAAESASLSIFAFKSASAPISPKVDFYLSGCSLFLRKPTLKPMSAAALSPDKQHKSRH